MKQRIERILMLADTTLDDLAVATHHYNLNVHFDSDGFIDSAIVCEHCPIGWITIYDCGSTYLIEKEIAKNLKKVGVK